MSNIKASVVAENLGETFSTKITVDHHHFLSDESVEVGGQDLAPDPITYLCGALASCTAITLRMYVQRKGWNVPKINVKVNLIKSDPNTRGNNEFYVTVSHSGNLSEEQQARILHIAKACPIHRLLTNPNEITTVVQ